MKYQFIETHRDFSVVKVCQTLKITKSGYYHWLKTRDNKGNKDQKLLFMLKNIFDSSRQTYGRPRLTQALKQKGFVVNQKRVHRLMKKHGIFAKTKKRFKPGSKGSKQNLSAAPNLVKRNFFASKPNELWFADITYILTSVGWLYLAAVIDAYSRKIVGWSMDKRQDSSLVCRALGNAVKKQRPEDGLIVHSDRGSQYGSFNYRWQCQNYGFVMSMSRKGNCYDNAMMESFFHSLKTEQVHWDKYKTFEEGKEKLFEYIEIFYNRVRLHSSLGYKSPVQFETAYYQS